MIPSLLLVFSQQLEILVIALISKDSNSKLSIIKEQYGRSLNGLDISIGDLYSYLSITKYMYRLSMIVQVNVVLNRTVVVDNE